MRGLLVVFVAPFGVRRKGTTRARVLPLARALAARGHRVRVLVPTWDDPRDCGRRERVGDAEVLYLPQRPAAGLAAGAALLFALLQASVAWRPDVVHCFKPIGYAGAVAWALGRRARQGDGPLVAVDCDDLEGRAGWATRDGRPSWQIALLDWQERLAPRSTGLVTVASRYLAARVAADPAVAARIVHLPNAAPSIAASPATFDASFTSPASPVTSNADFTSPASPAISNADSAIPAGATPGLLLYTRFNEFDATRAVSLLDAVLAGSDSPALTVVGDGPGRADFERAVNRKGWGQRVRYLGFLEGERLAVELSRDAVAVWPMDRTPINRARSPAKLLELMAQARPSVAEAVGEVGALLGTAGRLVQPGDDTGFARDVGRLLADEESRRVLGRAAAARAAVESWEQRAAALESQYHACT